MGAGGQKTEREVQRAEGFPATRVPSCKPPFSLADVRRAIPAHCFEKSTVSEGGVSLTRGKGNYLEHAMRYSQKLFVLTYTLMDSRQEEADASSGACSAPEQGAVATGVWVIAHECGHGAFSDYTWLNDAVGLVS
eukprot:1160634-Pelagomonas_calceolata.AAC.5